MRPVALSVALLLTVLLSTGVRAQGTGQTVRGVVLDRDTRAPLPGATVLVVGTDPLLGAGTDLDGRFEIRGVPLGRHTLEVRYVGYAPRLLPNVLVQSGQETLLEVPLQEQTLALGEAVVRAQPQDGRPLDDMAAVSARSFSVEESRRYAGAVDDPARLASGFAGVATSGTGVQDNALSIRGNAPRGVLWRLEGVEIPTPSHFAGLQVAGGGGQTLFSSQLLADSDVFTGAFPAAYGNALSGVFDMRFRTGNPSAREHTVQVGLLGLEVASEGPFRRGSPSTYLANYRYSTLGLLAPLLPTDGATTFQDLAFKLSFPTRRAGSVEVWGLGGLDGQTLAENPDSTAWEYDFWDRTRMRLDLGVGAGGVTHHLLLGSRTSLRTTAAATVHRTAWEQQRLADDLTLQPDLSLRNTSARVVLGTTLTHKVRPRHLNRSGVTVQQLIYDLDLQSAPDHAPPLVPVAQGDGRSTLVQAFTQSRLTLAPGLDVTAGVFAQHVALTGHTVAEPRLGLTWAVSDRQSVQAGYGLHSQIEDLRFYLVRPDGVTEPNRRLRPTRAHHVVVGTTRQISESVSVQLEGYVQRLFDVPVIADSSFSLLNVRQDWTFAEALVSDGAGENVGVEVTVERPLRGGVFALVTGSLFRSRYRGGDGVWRGSRFDQRYAVNALAGREVRVGSRNLLGASMRVAALGGERRSPVDEAASVARQEVVFDETRAFTVRNPGFWVVDLTLTYRINGRRASQVWALQLKNALAATDPALAYNLRMNAVETIQEGFPLPVLSYALDF